MTSNTTAILRYLLGREPNDTEAEWLDRQFSAARQEGRRAGLREASRICYERAEAERAIWRQGDPTPDGALSPDAASDKLDALAVSDPRGKVEQCEGCEARRIGL